MSARRYSCTIFHHCILWLLGIAMIAGLGSCAPMKITRGAAGQSAASEVYIKPIKFIGERTEHAIRLSCAFRHANNSDSLGMAQVNFAIVLNQIPPILPDLMLRNSNNAFAVLDSVELIASDRVGGGVRLLYTSQLPADQLVSILEQPGLFLKLWVPEFREPDEFFPSKYGVKALRKIALQLKEALPKGEYPTLKKITVVE